MRRPPRTEIIRESEGPLALCLDGERLWVRSTRGLALHRAPGGEPEPWATDSMLPAVMFWPFFALTERRAFLAEKANPDPEDLRARLVAVERASGRVRVLWEGDASGTAHGCVVSDQQGAIVMTPEEPVALWEDTDEDPRPIALERPYRLSALAGPCVYAESKNGGLMSAPRIGGPWTPLEHRTMDVKFGHAPDGALYAVGGVVFERLDSAILRLDREGRLQRISVESTGSADAIAVDATYVYYVRHIDSALCRVPRAGGRPELLDLPDEDEVIWALAVDAEHIYRLLAGDDGMVVDRIAKSRVKPRPLSDLL
jgi:hypothetical protein